MDLETKRYVPTYPFAHWLLMEALRELGVVQPVCILEDPTPSTRHGVKSYWTRKQCLYCLTAFMKRYGRVPTEKEWRQAQKYSIPSRATVRLYWSTFAALYKELGVASPPKGRRRAYHRG